MSGGDEYRDSPVRAYVITDGRARPSRNTIGIDTLLLAVDPDKPLPITTSRQHHELLRMCRRLLSLVEAAAYLELPVSVVGVLASDLVDAGRLVARPSIPEATGLDLNTLQEVLDGLRRLR
ncbi:hypothetical protein Misp01_25950 [Microtetraspora sp. NBRC 13810]|uniref:DUF742 domain-containing protein n=1 Tax=Microtetraspora sp. NBRC 13810 TaxID=3030990 RepID=UPI0024A0EE84|nr:DUF742 domain-containing protein [Microtetraspora sp. NBRC 13810]GLW07465.1 hypothetical protein Misp01_25950 [Microtetraspora sp. NBRC 13810]